MQSKFENDPYYDYSNVLIKPRKSTLTSRSEVDLNVTYSFKYSEISWSGVPIFAANMDTTGTFQIYNSLKEYKIITALHKFYKLKDFQNEENNLDPNYFAVSTGISDSDFQNLKEICEGVNVKFICIDIANGYMKHFLTFCQKVRKEFPNKVLIAGNVATPELTEELITIGKVDIVKIGIGPGSVCTTRKKTGVGIPQLSAVYNCSQAARNCGGRIIADGGLTCPGDVSKAYAAGGDFVMIGGMFSGHDENPGEIITENNQKFKLFYGMSSEHAMVKHFGKKNDYRASEGKVVKVPYRGPLKITVEDILGGVRSTCTYTNSRNLGELYKNAVFIQVFNQLNNIFS